MTRVRAWCVWSVPHEGAAVLVAAFTSSDEGALEAMQALRPRGPLDALTLLLEGREPPPPRSWTPKGVCWRDGETVFGRKRRRRRREGA